MNKNNSIKNLNINNALPPPLSPNLKLDNKYDQENSILITGHCRI